MKIPLEFVLTFPCFSIMNASSQDAVTMPFDDGTALVVLTDDDLVARFRGEENFEGPTIRFEHAAQLLAYIDYLPQHFTLIAIDPGEKSTFTVPISEFITRCLTELDGAC